MCYYTNFILIVPPLLLDSFDDDAFSSTVRSNGRRTFVSSYDVLLLLRLEERDVAIPTPVTLVARLSFLLTAPATCLAVVGVGLKTEGDGRVPPFAAPVFAPFLIHSRPLSIHGSTLLLLIDQGNILL